MATGWASDQQHSSTEQMDTSDNSRGKITSGENEINLDAKRPKLEHEEPSTHDVHSEENTTPDVTSTPPPPPLPPTTTTTTTTTTSIPESHSSPQTMSTTLKQESLVTDTLKPTPAQSPETLEEITPTSASSPPNGSAKSMLQRTNKNRDQLSRTASPSPSVLASRKTHMTRDQIRYCGAIMRNLKKHRDATPFLHRVDYVKMNIPDYPKVIKHPMDLSTVDRKLNNYEYDKVEDFVADIRLVFSNCYKYNGPEAMISMLCQNVESAFEKSLRQMPPSKEPSPPPRSHSPDRAKPTRKRSSKMLSPPPIRRTSGISEDGRPKREIHPPPSKDYPEPMTKRRNPRKNDQQMKFCMQTLRELKKSKYRDINYPFLAPVDIVALNIPDYPSIVKHPMDLSTIERKLNEGDYTTPEEFEADMRLMFNNCYLYNPPAIPVHKMGKELEKVFDDKWAQKPQPSPPETEQDIVDELEELEESDEDDRDHRIAELERHIATISQQIASIKTAKRKKPERSTSKAVAKRPSVSKEKKLARPVGEKRRRPTKRKDDELPEFTFEQKKDLSEQINNLAGDRLNTVVSIIQSSMPNLDGQGQEEIVLDIDALDRKTLHRLHEFVTGESLVPQHHHKKTVKRPRTHYSEADADRKIRELEKTLQKFNSGSEPRGYYGGQDSSSDSDSDSSSGSDSDDSGSSSD